MKKKTIGFGNSEYELDFDPVEKEFLITLDDPVKFGSETITEVKVSKPKWKHYKLLKPGPNGEIDLENLTEVASKITGLNMPQLDLFDPGDMFKVLGAVAFFMQPGAAQSK